MSDMLSHPIHRRRLLQGGFAFGAAVLGRSTSLSGLAENATATPELPTAVIRAVTGTPKHALVIFIDGGHPELYTPEHAPTITALGKLGTIFTAASVGFPSDSMSNIVGAFTGATFTENGLLYDYFYDRKFGQTIQLDETPKLPDGVKPTDLMLKPTLFQAARAKGLRTAFISKHPAYSILNGPTAGGPGIDDFRGPEIADWKGTQSEYDAMTFGLLREQILSGTPPDIMGLYALAPSGAMKTSGVDSADTVTAIKFIDDQIAQTIAALQIAGSYDDTVIVITADHGNTPTPKWIPQEGTGSISAFLEMNGIPVVHVTPDDLYMVYLKDESQTNAAIDLLSKPENRTPFGIDHILTQDDLKSMDAAPVDRTPDFVVIPTEGIVYAKKAKAAEHGGITAADLQVPLVLAGPGVKAGAVVADPVRIQQIAPTLAALLGLGLPTATFPPLAGGMVNGVATPAAPRATPVA